MARYCHPVAVNSLTLSGALRGQSCADRNRSGPQPTDDDRSGGQSPVMVAGVGALPSRQAVHLQRFAGCARFLRQRRETRNHRGTEEESLRMGLSTLETGPSAGLRGSGKGRTEDGASGFPRTQPTPTTASTSRSAALVQQRRTTTRWQDGPWPTTPGTLGKVGKMPRHTPTRPCRSARTGEASSWPGIVYLTSAWSTSR